MNTLLKNRVKASSLIKTIFAAESPEQAIKTVPAQSLFLALKQNGLLSSVELIEIASLDQTRLLMDLDCWEGDRFDEENFWDWLSLTDATEDLSILQKVVQSTDLKLVSLLISRYVSVEVFEEPTENPPAPQYFTPDKGYTWLLIRIEDSTKHFLMARLLAMIFETNAELFYQLIAIPGVQTDTMLEEEAYQDKSRRLSSEGIPDDELAAKINSSQNPATIKEELERKTQRIIAHDLPIVEPIIYEGIFSTPLQELLEKISSREEAEGELTLIMNAFFVRYQIPLSAPEEILEAATKVKYTISIGIESARLLSSQSDVERYNIIHFQGFYSLGLYELNELRKHALNISEDLIRQAKSDSKLFTIVAGLREVFPVIPNWFDSEADKTLEPGYRAIQSMAEIEMVKKFLQHEIGIQIN